MPDAADESTPGLHPHEQQYIIKRILKENGITLTDD
jgi:hypothetical protein